MTFFRVIVVFATFFAAAASAAESGPQRWYFSGKVDYIAVDVTADASPPMWKAMYSEGGDSVFFQVEDFTPKKLLKEQPRKILFADSKGLPVFGFYYADALCIGDIIVPGGTTVLGPAPQTFELRNFRYVGGGAGCAQTFTGVRDWSGRLIMSANEVGDVTMDIFLNTYSDLGELTYRRRLLGYVAKNINSPAYQRQQRLANEEKERARQAAVNEPIPRAVAYYGDETTACYRERKGATFESDFSRNRNITVCVGKPEYSRTQSSPDGSSSTIIYTCKSEDWMSEYEFCAAAWCVDRKQYYEYCYGLNRLINSIANRVRSLERY